MGPIDYGFGAQPVNLAQNFGQGLQVGNAINELQQRRAAEEAARQAAAQYQADTQAAMANPTPQAFAQLALRYPQHREAFKQGWEALSTEQQNNERRDAGELAAALQAGRPEVALSKIEQRIQAMKNSGQPTEQLEMMRDLVKTDPKQAYGALLHTVSGIPGGDKLLEGLGKVGTERRAEELQAPTVAKAKADAAKAGSDATTAAVTAKFAESQAVADLEKKGWDVKALQADIEFKKQSTRIAAMNAAIARENNDLKRRELQMKVDEAVAARESKVREKVATAEAGANSIDNMLNTIERIKKNPNLNDVVGGIEGRLPAVSDESVNAIALIETLGSQAFLAQIPNIKGMGALSNAEGEKLQSALQNLGRVQGEAQFRANLDEAARLLKKGREAISKSTGVPLAPPDTPAAPGSRPPLSAFERP